ncbi:transcription factor [Pseudoscourfieldia marina]
MASPPTPGLPLPPNAIKAFLAPPLVPAMAPAPPARPPPPAAGSSDSATLIPLAAIKRLIAGETGENKMGADALHLIHKASELFVEKLAAASVKKSDGETIGYDAVAAAVDDEDQGEFAFLSDLIPPTTTFEAYLAQQQQLQQEQQQEAMNEEA